MIWIIYARVIYIFTTASYIRKSEWPKMKGLPKGILYWGHTTQVGEIMMGMNFILKLFWHDTVRCIIFQWHFYTPTWYYSSQITAKICYWYIPIINLYQLSCCALIAEHVMSNCFSHHCYIQCKTPLFDYFLHNHSNEACLIPWPANEAKEEHGFKYNLRLIVQENLLIYHHKMTLYILQFKHAYKYQVHT